MHQLRRFIGRAARSPWVYLGWCALITLLLYGDALRLPFFFDDFVHLPYVDDYSLFEMWQTAGRLAYYRPLSFTLWKLMALAVGGHSPILQHGFNLLLHALNGALVGWLAARLWPDGRVVSAEQSNGRLRQYLSATLFLFFPFSYQAVPWIGALSHLLVTALVLLSLLAFTRFRATGDGRVVSDSARSNGRWRAISLALAFLAPFAHENGALIGPFVALIELTAVARRAPFSPGRALRRAALWTLPALLWLPIWWLAPKAISGGITLRGGETLLQNGAYFLQGLGYPLTWLGGPLRRQLGGNDLATAVALALAALALAAWLQRRGRSGRSLLPWLWFALAAVPSILFLTFDYVINGPRLLMLASVGAAWLWADLFVGLNDRARARARESVASNSAIRNSQSAINQKSLVLTMFLGFIFLLLLAQNAAFIRERMGLHQLLGDAYQATTAAALSAADEGRTAVFINHPSWLTPARAVYALGHEGALFWPDYAAPDDLAAIPGGRPARLERRPQSLVEGPSVRLVRVDAIRQSPPYPYGVGGRAPDWAQLTAVPAQFFVADYAADAITIRPAGRSLPLETGNAPLAAFALDGADRPAVLLETAVAHRTQSGLRISLVWRADAPVPPDVTVFAHALGGDGRLLAQADGDPLAGAFPFAGWTPGLRLFDTRYIDGDLPPDVAVRVGLYSRTTGERLTAHTPDGERWPDDAVPVPIAIE